MEIPKAGAQNVLLWEKWLVVCLFKESRSVEHQSVVLKGVCGEKYIQECAVCVVTDPFECVYVCVREH